MSLYVRVLLPCAHWGKGPSYTCLSLCRHLSGNELRVDVTVPIYRGLRRPRFVKPALAMPWSVLPYRFIRGFAATAAEKRFLGDIEVGQAAYLWSEVSIETALVLKRRGIAVIREKTNCHKCTAARLLEDAYARVNLRPMHGITAQRIAKEREELDLAEFVFSASPMVTASLMENGISPDKIINSSYGWDPARLGGANRRPARASEVTVIFVGGVSVDKGAHILLEAWSRAGLKGRLVLIGMVDPAFGRRFAHLLSRPDVLTTGFVRNVGAYYRSADIFAFPSIVEGGPLVTYEALANGLPAVVSPMGAGRAVRNLMEGFIVDPYDSDGWVETLRAIAINMELRLQLSSAAKERAAEFTWQLVGAARRECLVRRIVGDAGKPMPTAGEQAVL